MSEPSRLTMRNRLLLYRELADLQKGKYVVEELVDGRQLVLTLPGTRKKRRTYHTRNWDAVLSIVDSGKDVEDITYDAILRFIFETLRKDQPIGQLLLKRVLEVCAGAEPENEVRLRERFTDDVVVVRTDEYILKSLKWLGAIEDRYIFSEIPAGLKNSAQGRFAFLQFLAEAAQGVSFDSEMEGLDGKRGYLPRSAVNYEAVNGLRQYFLLCDQMYDIGGRKCQPCCTALHHDCKAAVNYGILEALQQLAKEGDGPYLRKRIGTLFWHKIHQLFKDNNLQ